MHKKINTSLGVKIFRYYAIVVIPCIVLCVLAVSWYSRNIIQKEFYTNINQVMQSADESMKLMVNDIENVITNVQSNKQVQEVLGGTDFYRRNIIWSQSDEISLLKTALLAVDAHEKKISNMTLYVLDREKYPSNDYEGIIRSDVTIKNEVWYQKVMNNPYETQWDVYYNELDRNSYIAISRVILNTTNCKPVAIVQAKILVSDFTSRIDRLSLAKTGKIFLTTDSRVINTSQSKYVSNLKNNTEYFEKVSAGEPFETEIKLNNTKSLIYSVPLKKKTINITSMVPYEEIQASSKVMSRFVALMVLLAIMLLCIMLYFVSKYITEPIRNLAVSIGNYDLRTNEAIGPITDDEVGIVAKSFNTLTSTLHNLINDITTLHEQQQMARLKLLQAQINPHFLYNTLNSISCMARKHNAPDIDEVVLALSYFFKHSLNGGREYTTIKNEVEHVKSYFVIQNMRFKGKYELNVDVSDEILDNKILKLTLQPLVENCIVHAFKDIDYVGIINLTGYKEDGKIYLKVSDNGYGTNVDELNKAINNPEQSNKYGTTNVNQRIKLYFGDEYGLKYYESDDGGLLAVVCIGDESI